MIRLKNIVKNDNLVECDIIPEDSQNAGRLTVDLQSEDIVSYTLPEGYEYCKVHVRHACTAIVRMNHEGKILKEKLVMWY